MQGRPGVEDAAAATGAGCGRLTRNRQLRCSSMAGRVSTARVLRGRPNLFAPDAGTGEKITEAPGVPALRLNEKFLALEMAGVV
jgi:hypothetical protein